MMHHAIEGRPGNARRMVVAARTLRRGIDYALEKGTGESATISTPRRNRLRGRGDKKAVCGRDGQGRVAAGKEQGFAAMPPRKCTRGIGERKIGAAAHCVENNAAHAPGHPGDDRAIDRSVGRSGSVRHSPGLAAPRTLSGKPAQAPTQAH